MLIKDDSEFVKSQIDFHKRLALTGKDEHARRRHELLAGRFELLFQNIWSTDVDQSQPGAAEAEEELLEQEDGGNIPARTKLRLGDISDLPPKLREQLCQRRRDELEQIILDVINEKFGGAAAIDEIMVEVWRMTKQVIGRQPLSTKLYRMTKKEVLFPVPKRKGIYSTTPIAA